MDAQQCEQGSLCMNSIEHKGAAMAACRGCKLSPVNIEDAGDLPHRWRPIDGKTQHPVLVQEKRQAAKDKNEKKRLDRLGRDKSRTLVLKRAERAERRTTSTFIQATRNSGRVNQDGDHKVANTVTLDTKHQSTRDNPVVFLAELFKVQADSVRAGTTFGALVLRPKNGLGVVAVHEKDFAKLCKMLTIEEVPE